MSVHELKYNSVPESEALFYEEVYQILENNNVTGKLRQDFLLSLSEAFTNAMTHGNKMNSKAIIYVRLTINEEKISADIIDEGIGGLEAINNRKRVGLMSEGGRGIDLMRHFSNGMTFDQQSKGLKVTISFCRHKIKPAKDRV